MRQPMSAAYPAKVEPQDGRESWPVTDTGRRILDRAERELLRIGDLEPGDRLAVLRADRPTSDRESGCAAPPRER